MFMVVGGSHFVCRELRFVTGLYLVICVFVEFPLCSEEIPLLTSEECFCYIHNCLRFSALLACSCCFLARNVVLFLVLLACSFNFNCSEECSLFCLLAPALLARNTAFCCNFCRTLHVLFGRATDFDFSLGNYRSITTIGFLYFVFEHGSSLSLFFLLWAELFGRAWLCFVVFIYATFFRLPLYFSFVIHV